MAYSIGEIVKVKNPAITSQSGGTEFLDVTVHAKINQTFFDSEIGRRYIGELVREEDIALSLKTGKSNFTPEHYKRYSEEIYKSTLKEFEEYNPKKVFFGEDDIL